MCLFVGFGDKMDAVDCWCTRVKIRTAIGVAEADLLFGLFLGRDVPVGGDAES
jgi:hypothetical protein